MAQQSQFKWKEYLQENRPDINIVNFKGWCRHNRPKKQIFDTEQELLEAIIKYTNNKQSDFKWKQYIEYNRPDISTNNFANWCANNRPKKQIFDTEQELLQSISLYDNRLKSSKFNWQKYLKGNKPDININSFKGWCQYNRAKKSVFDTEQELLQAIIKYNNRENKRPDFKWQQYLKENRPDINIDNFKSWCYKHRPNKQIFNTEQELLETIIKYNNNRRSDFKWQQYIEYNRHDINIHSFTIWCANNRPKKSVFNTEEELLETLQLYDNRENKRPDSKWQQYLKENRPDITIVNFRNWCISNRPKKSVFDTKQELIQAVSLYDKQRRILSQFNWKQYLKENRQDINIQSFANWCTNNRPKKQIFNTEQELLETLQLYDNRRTLSKFNWKQYLKENRPDINILKFTSWCSHNRLEKSIFDTEQELIEAILRYNLYDRYIVQKTKYQGIYNLTEKGTGLRFNFYKLEDMLGLL